jgi:rRNA maturation endonuclease Nob1
VTTTSRYSSDVCDEAYVLDAAAFFAGYQLYLTKNVYTVKEVIQEVKDSESLKNLQLALSAGRVEILEPGEAHRERINRLAGELNMLSKLSKADLELLALASDLRERCGRVVVISDDSAVRRVATRIGAATLTIKYWRTRTKRK